MTINIYVDGSGGPNSKYGFHVKETGESKCESLPNMTNNEAEYRAIIAALEWVCPADEQINIYSDSEVVVNQINHKYAINSGPLRELAREIWPLLKKLSHHEIIWIPREKNIAGKMLGS